MSDTAATKVMDVDWVVVSTKKIFSPLFGKDSHWVETTNKLKVYLEVIPGATDTWLITMVMAVYDSHMGVILTTY